MNGLVHAHSGFRWIVLILLLVAIFRAAMRRNKEYDKNDAMINLFAMISVHVQVTIGIILAFFSPKVNYTKGWVGVDYLRFYGLEHMLLMVIAAIVLTIGRKRAEKKDTSVHKHTQIFIWYTIALLIIIAGIPWPFRDVLGADWF